MFRTRHTRARGRRRLIRLSVLGVLLAGAAWGSYELYNLRKHWNTRELLHRGREAVAAEDWDNAAIAYRQYVQREPESVEGLRAYSDVLLEKARTTPEVIGDAVRTLRRLVGKEPANIDAIEKLAGLYLGLRENRMAEELAESWRTLDPISVDAILALATARYRLGKAREAADTLLAAISENPSEPDFYPLLVNLLAGELNQPEEAQRRLGDALRVGADAPGVQLAAFAFYQSQGRPDDAEKHLRRALDLAPESPEVLLPAGQFALSQGRLDEAKTLLDRAAQVAPENPRVLSALAMWATRKGDKATLIATAEEFSDLAGQGYPEFLAEATRLYLRAGELDRADQCLARLESLPIAPEQLGERLDVLKGARAFQGGEFYSAINHLRAALQREPTDVRTTRMLADAYTGIADLDGAVDLYQRVIRMEPADADARFRVAELAWRLGRISEARQAVDGLSEASDAQKQTARLIKVACTLREAESSPLQTTPGGGEGERVQEREAYLRELERLTAVDRQEASPQWLMRCLVLAGLPERAVDLFHARRPPPHTPAGEAGGGAALGAELGHLLLSEGLGERVLALAGEVIEQFPNDPEGHVLRAKALAGTGRLSDALAEYADTDRCSLPAAAWGQVLEAIADEQLIAGQIEPGMQLYRRAADLSTDNVSVRRKLIRRTTELNEAMQRSEEIRALEGDQGPIWKSERAGALLRLGPLADRLEPGDSLSTARELLEQCLTQRPRWPSVRLQLGYAYELGGDFEKAVESYQTALAQEPSLSDSPAAIRLVGLLNRLGRWAQADAVLASLTALSPDKPEVLRLQTEQNIRERDFDSAITTAERLLELKPEDPAWAVVAVDLHLRVGNPARAEEIARTALVVLPDSAPLLWSLVRALIAQHRLADAEELARKAVAETNDATHHIVLARVLALLNRQSEAEKAIVQAQDLAPQDAAVWAACADFWASVNRRAPRIACTRKAIELHGENPAESLALARLLAIGGSTEETAEADEILQQYRSAHPGDAQALLLEGQLALVREPADSTKAEKSLTRALEIDPKLPEAYRLLGSMQVRAGQLTAARETIAAGIAFAPDDPHLLLASAEIHTALGDDERAIPPLLRLLKLRPRTPTALRLLAGAYVKTNQVDRAIAFLEAQVPEDSRTPDEMVILATLNESANNVERAEELFRRAKALDENSSAVHRELIYFLARRGSFDEVHALASTRQALHPNDVESLAVAAEVLCSLCDDEQLRDIGLRWLDDIVRDHPAQAADAGYRSAICHYKQGRLDVAEGKFLEALRLAPTHARSVNDLAWLYTEDRAEPEKAVALIERFLSLGGVEGAHLIDTHGVALMRLGRFDDAEQKARQCLKIAGNTPTRTAATYHLGVALLRSGRLDDAKPYLRQAMELQERRGGLTPREQEELGRLLAPETSIDNAGTYRREG